MKSETELRCDPVSLALAEDIGAGDVTCEFFVPENQMGRARIIAKEPAVVAGAETAAEAFARVDSTLAVSIVLPSGTQVALGETVLEVSGRVRSILTGERVALNFLQRLSGVATLTNRFVQAVQGTKARILDTRKTTPGLRALEKAAVKSGGGTNHRFGLYDMVLVKDNHLAAKHDPEFLRGAIARVRAERPGVRIEIETDTIEQVRMLLGLGEKIDFILLDNMTLEQMCEAVKLGAGRVQFEASGGVNLDTVAAIAATGVDFISIGALTHSARAIDFSLELLQ